MGREGLRLIRASMSASYHILSALDAPARSAIQVRASKALAKSRWRGAIQRPTKAVNTASDITRGLVKATNWRIHAPICRRSAPISSAWAVIAERRSAIVGYSSLLWVVPVEAGRPSSAPRGPVLISVLQHDMDAVGRQLEFDAH